jgi:hypothetical protein
MTAERMFPVVSEFMAVTTEPLGLSMQNSKQIDYKYLLHKCYL